LNLHTRGHPKTPDNDIQMILLFLGQIVPIHIGDLREYCRANIVLLDDVLEQTWNFINLRFPELQNPHVKLALHLFSRWYKKWINSISDMECCWKNWLHSTKGKETKTQIYKIMTYEWEHVKIMIIRKTSQNKRIMKKGMDPNGITL
jgi:hypothetical protein